MTIRTSLAVVCLALMPLKALALSPLLPDIYGTWRLVAVDGVKVRIRFTLDTTDPSHFTGQGPCNGWSAVQRGDGFAIDFGPIVTTRMTCDDIAAETEILGTLATMTLAKVGADGILNMVGAQGHSLNFVRIPAQ